MIRTDALEDALRGFLPAQRWFGGAAEVEAVTVAEVEVLRPPWPALVRATVAPEDGDGDAGAADRWNVVLGLRPAGKATSFLDGHPAASLGELETDAGPAHVYEALLDPELAIALLAVVAPDEEAAQHVRFVAGEQTNTSLVYDDRLILKVFRRLAPGSNPDVEVPGVLAAHGFPHVPRPVAVWRQGDVDLGVVKEYLAGGTEGWSLALTSLRDLCADHGNRPAPDPEEAAASDVTPAGAGGDFAGEARRLGEMTADLHGALADAFGRGPGDAGAWADAMEEQLRQVHHRGLDRTAMGDVVARLRWVPDAGPAVRAHGDYHLGQVLRTDAGWHVLDFEGEPARPLAERRRPTSPLKDVAGMLRSFHYAACVAEREREEAVPELARAWEDRNRRAFLEGYLPAAAKADLVPADDESCALVLRAFELEKAVYEVAYEQAHRPEWVDIPVAAVSRLLAEAHAP